MIDDDRGTIKKAPRGALNAFKGYVFYRSKVRIISKTIAEIIKAAMSLGPQQKLG